MIPLRDENPTRIFPVVTYLLIAVNIAVFYLQSTGGMYEANNALRGWMAGWTLVPAELTSGRDYAINGPSLQPIWLTLLTSMFMHGGLLHLIGNMLYLFIFGNNIEDALGHFKFLVFYIVCGILAALSQVFYSPQSIIPTLGASGAIAGVLGGYILLFPRAAVNTLVFLGIFITTIRVPAFILLGFWIVSQFFSQWTHSLMTEVTGKGETGGVAYLAHIGGFVAGLILIKLFGPEPTPEDYNGPDIRRPRSYGPRHVVINKRW